MNTDLYFGDSETSTLSDSDSLRGAPPPEPPDPPEPTVGCYAKVYSNDGSQSIVDFYDPIFLGGVFYGSYPHLTNPPEIERAIYALYGESVLLADLSEYLGISATINSSTAEVPLGTAIQSSSLSTLIPYYVVQKPADITTYDLSNLSISSGKHFIKVKANLSSCLPATSEEIEYIKN